MQEMQEKWVWSVWVRKIPWRRKFLSSCLKNSTDRGAWRATVHGVTKSQTRLSTHAGPQGEPLHLHNRPQHSMSQEVPTTPSLLLLLLSRFSRVRLCVTPWTAAHQAPPSLGFSRQEHWSGLPFPSPMHESGKWEWSRSVMSTPSDPMDCSPPGSSIHGIFWAILEDASVLMKACQSQQVGWSLVLFCLFFSLFKKSVFLCLVGCCFFKPWCWAPPFSRSQWRSCSATYESWTQKQVL